MSKGKLFFKSQDNSPENWISIADLMAGLMMVFMLIAIGHVLIGDPPPPPPPPNPCPIECTDTDPITAALRDKEQEIRDALNQEFEYEFDKWGAYIPPESLTVRFRNQNNGIFFGVGESNLNAKSEEILANFFPRYVGILLIFDKFIHEIRIEGHTSSKWEKIPFDEEDPEQYAFIENMKLSQERTQETMLHVLNLDAFSQNKEYRKWVREKITANGLSSVRLLNSKGEEVKNKFEEDENLSRRVEFTVRINVEEVIKSISSKDKD